MRAVKNISGLLLLISLLAMNGTGLNARLDSFDIFWCDEPTTTQEGVICSYSAHCYFDATPGQEWPGPPGPETTLDWYDNWCSDYYWGPNYNAVESELDFLCKSYANGYGDPFGWMENLNYASYTPYPATYPSVWSGYCADGELDCRFQLEGMCP